MKNVRVDHNGDMRCWNCGSKGFTEKRTFRAKAMVGVGALLTKKKLKCQRCGEYNDTGGGKAYDGPAARKYRKEWEAEKARLTPAEQAAPTVMTASITDELARLGELHHDGVLDETEFAAAKAKLLGGGALPPPPPPT